MVFFSLYLEQPRLLQLTAFRPGKGIEACDIDFHHPTHPLTHLY